MLFVAKAMNVLSSKRAVFRLHNCAQALFVHSYSRGLQSYKANSSYWEVNGGLQG
jgi:hypothetical protein